MKQLDLFFWSSLLLLGTTHCGQSAKSFERVNGAAAGPVIDLTKQDSLTLRSALFHFEHYVALDSSVAIGSISKVIADSSGWYVGDFKNTKEVYCFALDGRLKWQCNLSEKEAGHQIANFDFNARTGLLMVAKGEHLYQYDRSGNLVATTANPPLLGQIACLGAQNTTLVADASGSNMLATELGPLDLNGQVQMPRVPFFTPLTEVVSGLRNLNRTFRPDTLLFGQLLNDTLYHVCATGVWPCATLHFDDATKNLQHSWQGQEYATVMRQLTEKTGAAAPDLLYETENTLHFACLQQGRYQSVYYDKKQATTRVVNPHNNDALDGVLGITPFATLPGDRYVYVLEPYEIFRVEATRPLRHPMTQAMRRHLHKLSNPVLVIGQFKSVQNQQLAQDEKSKH